MKIFLTEQEMKNVVAGQSMENIKIHSEGKYWKWKVEKVYEPDEGYCLEYKYDEGGNTKEKFVKLEESA